MLSNVQEALAGFPVEFLYARLDSIVPYIASGALVNTSNLSVIVPTRSERKMVSLRGTYQHKTILQIWQVQADQ